MLYMRGKIHFWFEADSKASAPHFRVPPHQPERWNVAQMITIAIIVLQAERLQIARVCVSALESLWFPRNPQSTLVDDFALDENIIRQRQTVIRFI